MERKSLVGKLEVKFATDAKSSTMTGYGAVFNNVDAYGDIIAPGAFTKTIEEHRLAKTAPAMLLNHDFLSIPIGIWDSLEEDTHGLKVGGTFLDTSTGSDAYTAAKAGAITGLSIGYIVTSDEIKGGQRHILEVKLLEISLVTFPANDQARVVDVKSADTDILQKMNVEIAFIASELKSLSEKLNAQFKSVKSDDEDEDEEKSFDDDEDCDCDPEEDEDCDCDDEEDKSEAKYNQAALMAVQTLTLKLSQEKYGR